MTQGFENTNFGEDTPNYSAIEAAYQIKGFRSLVDFSINLTPGLNVFVGPNGSGKTNFIEFLDFLSILLVQNVSTAVSRAGGVARAFSQENSKRDTAKITATVRGTADIRPFSREDKSFVLFDFEYDVEINFSRVLSLVFVASETIRFKKMRKEGENPSANPNVGAISITRRATRLEKPVLNIGTRLKTKNYRNPCSVRARFSSSALDFKNELESISVGPDESILSIRSGVAALDAIRYSLSRGRSFNFIPERVRAPDDLTRTPYISPDGSGLTSTLYQLQRAKSPTKMGSTRVSVNRFSPDDLDNVVEWTKLVFPELDTISVQADPHTGKYLGYLHIGRDGLRIPLQAASDGTLKWLAFVTLIITKGGAYSIEEPENFLHPKMQQSLIDLIRDHGEDGGRPGYFIISTHSETIVNKCKPSELILFQFRDGKTVCSRLRNQKSVSEQINKTGFGLGYYYASNAVS